MLSGFSINSPVSDIINADYGTGDVSDSSGFAGYLTMLNAIIDFFFMGGVIGLLASAGMPWEIQLLVGAPLTIIAIVMLAPLLKAGVGFIFAAFR